METALMFAICFVSPTQDERNLKPAKVFFFMKEEIALNAIVVQCCTFSLPQQT